MVKRFEKTDRMVSILNEAYTYLSLAYPAFEGATKLKKKRPNLYDTLIQITASRSSIELKKKERVAAFAKEFGLDSDLEKAEGIMLFIFDEENLLRSLCQRYWQLKGGCINGDLNDTSKLKNFMSKLVNELFIDDVVNIVQRNEPSISDIENEFWENCQNPSDINAWCNIYREKFVGHLKDVSLESFGWENILNDPNNDFYPLFKDLRVTGLLTLRETDAEIALSKLANKTNEVCSKIVEVFRRLRESTKDKAIGNVSKNIQKPTFETFDELIKERYRGKASQIKLILKGGERGLITSHGKDLDPLINDLNEWTGNKQAARVFCQKLSDKGLLVTNKVASLPVATAMNNSFNGLGVDYIKNQPGYNAQDYSEYFEIEINRLTNDN